MYSATMYSDLGLFSQYLTYMYRRRSCIAITIITCTFAVNRDTTWMEITLPTAALAVTPLSCYKSQNLSQIYKEKSHVACLIQNRKVGSYQVFYAIQRHKVIFSTWERYITTIFTFCLTDLSIHLLFWIPHKCLKSAAETNKKPKYLGKGSTACTGVSSSIPEIHRGLEMWK